MYCAVCRLFKKFSFYTEMYLLPKQTKTIIFILKEIFKIQLKNFFEKSKLVECIFNNKDY